MKKYSQNNLKTELILTIVNNSGFEIFRED